MSKDDYRLSAEQVHEFENQGYVYLNGYVPATTLTEVRGTISRWASNYAAEFNHDKFVVSSGPDLFDAGLVALRNENNEGAGRLYDAIKKMPPFMQWAIAQRHVETARTLLRSSDIGVASRGWGMRIDYPDNKHATQLHQDFVSQLCGPRAIVIWAPLRDVTAEMGPVVLFPGSHLEGVFPIQAMGVQSEDLIIRDESLLRNRFSHFAPEVKAGDAVVMDLMLLHESGNNLSHLPRWSMLTRLFDAGDSRSVRIGWRGGIQEGNVYSDSLLTEMG
jgi:ectoine hydroxylase-related dioxygenase (phytanoyl-CoA dioxygenase family)